MKTIATSLFHRVLEPENSTAAVHPTLIMLHGRGADEEDLLGLSSFLDNRLLIISARAPFGFPYGGYTWYDIGQVGVPLPGMFDESYAKLNTFVDDVLRGYPVDPSRLYLFGFSSDVVRAFADETGAVPRRVGEQRVCAGGNISPVPLAGSGWQAVSDRTWRRRPGDSCANGATGKGALCTIQCDGRLP
jgi:hypothetical protein